MHPPTRRRSRPPLLHQQPEIPPIEPISAEPLAYPPETPVPYLAANISSGSTSPHLVMSRNKRTSPPTAKPHRLLTGPRYYAYVFPRALPYNHAPCRALESKSARRFAALSNSAGWWASREAREKLWRFSHATGQGSQKTKLKC